MTSKNTIAIVGGGIVGLSIGWQLLRRGFPVEIFERDQAGRAASWVAAGMLAPVSEAGFEEMDLLNLNRASIELYPRFAEELLEDSGIDIEFRTEGTLMIAVDRDQNDIIRRLFEFRKSIDLPVEWLSGSAARERVPELSPSITSAMWVPNDYQVDNRSIIKALIAAIEKLGGKLFENTPVNEIRITGNAVTGISLNGGEEKEFSRVLLASGAWARTIKGVPEGLKPPIRPVRGQVIILRMTEDFTLDTVLRSPEAYLAPKKDGRLIVGTTVEEKGFEFFPTAGGVKDILESVWEMVPGIYDLPLEEINVGFRPTSRDNAPILSDTPVNGFFIAGGHFRHGILQAPATAYGMASLIAGEKPPELLQSFSLLRFT